ncbi:hypothetical protein RU07_04880 [Agrobacterium tumefaciens]|uniref:DUF992 domain-containing protein n=1 Tax=Agrobacterium tumefaciens TaxID=358 RepID=A0A0D0L2S2_AGRTU|nr:MULTISPECIES: DUF992 domain-containing protein [unclassified Rhizobium]KIQ04008.1 hypothetical protein RU07_04880 [Agrobacterium tumefaciens]MBD8687432.1 DUF992 domain-containing protein [Rhizobium sp. CFBP 13644]MBD8691886.1 DUF992 domain-containing protein [Rhizobium sp. CFBP 13717]
MKKALAVTFAAMTLGLGGTASAIAADMTYSAPVVQDQDDRNGVKIGYLTCEVGGGVGYVIGSSKELDCTFQSTMGARRTDHYSGAIRKMGVDLGFTTQGKLVWAVFAPTAGYHRGSLGGLYQGATAEATLGLGVGANVLVGGTAGSIQLQTISVTGQVGLNLAATGTSVTLTPING